MSGERYYLITPRADVPLDGTFRPQQLSPTVVSANLVRARGYTRIFNLSDGLPDPIPIVLNGTMQAEDEAALSLDLRTLREQLRAATAIRRENRTPISIMGASLLAVPIDDDSSQASVTITLLPIFIPDTVSDGFDW